MIRCKEHAADFLRKRGYKVQGAYWVEDAGDSREGLDTIGYVNSEGVPRRAYLQRDPKSPEGRPRFQVKATVEGW